MQKILLSFALTVLMAISSVGGGFAQNQQVSGSVKGPDGEPLLGATVIVTQTQAAVLTDAGGLFSISAPKDGTLKVSYLGLKTTEIAIDGRTRLDIVMEHDNKQIDEVIVVAFGSQKKESFTGSAGILKKEDLALLQNSNPAAALQGRVAGLILNNSSGQFGESPSITIRGVGSISSGTEPLYIVDGMPFEGNLDRINSNDIESITVLKDAASNALYGARGANGVVMITTKKGSGVGDQVGDAKITFDAKWGVNTSGLQSYEYIKNPAKWYETYYTALYNKFIREEGATQETAHRKANDALMDSGSGPGYIVYSLPDGADLIGTDGKLNSAASLGRSYTSDDGQSYYLTPDDWEDEILRNGLRQEYNISISGGSRRLSYYSSFGYLNSKGITDNSDMERFTGRLKADYQAKKWLKTGASMSYTRNSYDKISEGTYGSTSNVFTFIHAIGPIYPMYVRSDKNTIMRDEWGQQMYDFGNGSYPGLSRQSMSGSNPAFNNKYNQNNTEGNNFIGNVYADINFMPDLKLTLNASMNDDEYRYTGVTDPFTEHYGTTSDNGYVYKSHSRRFTYNYQQILNWTPSYGKNHLNIMVGHEYFNRRFYYLYAARYNMAIDGNSELNGALNDSQTSSSYVNRYNNEGYFGRVLYDYDDKYFLSASYRRDASSRFAKENRWGNFWSAGAAWLINRESWFEAKWVDQLKLKFSVGSQGNDNIGDYLYTDQYSIGVDSDNNPTYEFYQKGTKNITWETNTNWNAGVEFSLFGDRLSGSVDYFYRKTSDMLFKVTTAPSIGYTNYYANVGDMRNSGIEVVLNGTVIRTQNIRWDLNLNISHVANKILSLPADIKTLNVEGHDGYSHADPSYVSKYKYFFGEDLPLYTWYMPRYAGVDEEGLSLWYKYELDDEGNRTGNLITTGEYSQADDFLCGTALPKVSGGFGTTFYAYGFDLTLQCAYQIGGKALDYNYMSSLSAPSAGFGGNWHKDVAKAWTPENHTNVPRFVAGDANQNSRSDRFLISASYLSLQTLALGYTLPQKWTNKLSIGSIRVYLSCENLAYLSARKGFDPRQSLMGFVNAQTYTPIRSISGGFTINF